MHHIYVILHNRDKRKEIKWLKRQTCIKRLSLKQIGGNLCELILPLDTTCFHISRAKERFGGVATWREGVCSSFWGEKEATLDEEVVIWSTADLFGGGVVVPQWHRFEEDNAYKWDHYWHSGRLFGFKETPKERNHLFWECSCWAGGI